MLDVGCQELAVEWMWGMRKGEEFPGPWLEDLLNPWELMRSPREKIQVRRQGALNQDPSRNYSI